jgi:hypothetical protein
MYMKRLLRRFGVKSGDKVEPRTMQTEGEAGGDTKLKLAS